MAELWHDTKWWWKMTGFEWAAPLNSVTKLHSLFPSLNATLAYSSFINSCFRRSDGGNGNSTDREKSEEESKEMEPQTKVKWGRRRVNSKRVGWGAINGEGATGVSAALGNKEILKVQTLPREAMSDHLSFTGFVFSPIILSCCILTTSYLFPLTRLMPVLQPFISPLHSVLLRPPVKAHSFNHFVFSSSQPLCRLASHSVAHLLSLPLCQHEKCLCCFVLPLQNTPTLSHWLTNSDITAAFHIYRL